MTLALPGAMLALATPVTQAPSRGPLQPFVVEHYYKVRWGFGREFMRLFRKNHLPLLLEQKRMGRILDIRIEQPLYHAAEDASWDIRVTLTWKDAAAAHDDHGGGDIRRRLYPDEALFRREEQHRLEILRAHWDVVIEPVTLD